MRIIECRQQTEEWESWRNRPTASGFREFISAVRGQYSSQATTYACKIVAKRLGVYTEPPPSFWMEWGNEHEPNAKHCYTRMTGQEIREVGFCLPDHTDAFGGSPDGLLGKTGIIEIKCPKPETLIRYHAEGGYPDEYKPQVQGLLMITGREWCQFMAYHPQLTPYFFTVQADEDYQLKIASCLLKLLAEINEIEAKVKREQHELVSNVANKSEVQW